LWERTQPILTSPVRETYYLYNTSEELRHLVIEAGHTALSRRTMIADNSSLQFFHQWSRLQTFCTDTYIYVLTKTEIPPKPPYKFGNTSP
jgi:hypothetical protein